MLVDIYFAKFIYKLRDLPHLKNTGDKEIQILK